MISGVLPRDRGRRATAPTSAPAWHDTTAVASEMADCRDRIAAGYERWWAPVMTPRRSLLDLIAKAEAPASIRFERTARRIRDSPWFAEAIGD
jgi:hypothetical protein